MSRRALSIAVYALSSAIGVTAFLAPFFGTGAQEAGSQMAGATTAPLLLTALVGLCFLALLFEVQGAMLGAKSVALLGVLVAINASLRFAEVAFPGPGGFSPIFLLIILAGYSFGGRFGFLTGAMTILISGVITGGVGPWLPYQMFAAGWVGLATALVRRGAGLLRLSGRAEIMLLAAYGGLCGFAYGAIMNLWFWPWSAGPASHYWAAGISAAETAQRYLAFYTLTSLVWDALGAAGNIALIALFGAPILRALARFHDRFVFVYRAEGAR